MMSSALGFSDLAGIVREEEHESRLELTMSSVLGFSDFADTITNEEDDDNNDDNDDVFCSGGF